MRIGSIIKTTHTASPEVKTFVRDFKIKCTKRFCEEQRNQFGRVTHVINHELSNAILLCCVLQQRYGYAAIAGAFSLVELGLDKLFHKKSSKSSEFLKYFRGKLVLPGLGYQEPYTPGLKSLDSWGCAARFRKGRRAPA